MTGEIVRGGGTGGEGGGAGMERGAVAGWWGLANGKVKRHIRERFLMTISWWFMTGVLRFSVV